MQIGRLATSLILAFGTTLAFSVPRVLIVDQGGESKAVVAIADAVAEAVEEAGKLDPVVWSITDPIFRDATLDGRVRQGSGLPSPDQVQDAAKSLKCEYVIYVKAEIKETSVTGRLDLLKGAKAVWKDSLTMDAGRNSLQDLENTVRSIARTWSVKISGGPLKSLQAEPKPPETPSAAPGQAPKVDLPADPAPKHTDDPAKLFEEYEKLMSSKQTGLATRLLRDAIDANPLEPKLRIKLIEHLRQIGRPEDAASEAKRASLLIPDNADLRALAANVYAANGQADQARIQLNEALARNPDDLAARSSVVDLDLASMRLASALEHVNIVLQKAPTKDLYYRRATIYASLGDLSGVVMDLADGEKAPKWSSSAGSTYSFCFKVLDRGLEQSIGDLRSLLQRATVRRDDPEVKDLIDTQAHLVQVRQKFLDGWPPPAAFKNSHGKRRLALNLLAQYLSELRAYLADGNEDTLTDASIDLNEAIKQLSSSRDALNVEQGSVATHGSTAIYPSY